MEADKNLQSSSKFKPSQQQLNKKFEELYNQSSRKKQKLQQMKEERERLKSEKQLKQCTFHPKINPDPVFHGSKLSSFIKREQDWLSRKQKRIEQMAKQNQTKDIQGCSFHPVISSKSIDILQNPSIYTQKDKKIVGNDCKRLKNSYRQIYKRKQLEKNSSEICLMTQKRSQMKKIYQVDHQQRAMNKIGLTFSPRKSTKYGFQVKGSQSYDSQDQNTQQILVKTEEQDTFNSISSIEVKTQSHYQGKEEKSRIMIFDHDIENDHQRATLRSNLEGNEEFAEGNLIEEDQGQTEQNIGQIGNKIGSKEGQNEGGADEMVNDQGSKDEQNDNLEQSEDECI